MTKTEKEIDNIIKNTEKISFEELLILVHESYLSEYLEEAELSLEYVTEKRTGLRQWKLTDVQNDKTYICNSPRECYEVVYQEILEHCFMKELEKEREDERAKEIMTPREYRDWCQW